MDMQKAVESLTVRLEGQKRASERFENYYDGTHPWEFTTSRYQTEFGAMLSAVSDNWMPIVVDAVEERLNVNGFRMSEELGADSEAWDIWQRNQLDLESEICHSVALRTGISYALVWPEGSGRDLYPSVAINHPSEMTVMHSPGNRRKSVAALKELTSEDGGISYYLWTSEEFFELVRKNGTYEQVQRHSHKLGRVPVIQFSNRPNIRPGKAKYKSELFDVISTQDQINKLVRDMLVASEFAAFRQRWATGIQVDIGDDGKPVAPWQIGLDRMFTSPEEGTRFGEFGASDLGNYIAAIQNRIQSLASRTRTPPHYLLGGMGQFPSGESLKAAESGLVAKTRSRQKHFGESWEDVMRLGFKVLGDDARASYWRAETVWGDPESRTEAQHVDSALKLLAVGVPKEGVWEYLNFTPVQIDRFKLFLLEEGLSNGISGPVEDFSTTLPDSSDSFAGSNGGTN